MIQKKGIILAALAAMLAVGCGTSGRNSGAIEPEETAAAVRTREYALDKSENRYISPSENSVSAEETDPSAESGAGEEVPADPAAEGGIPSEGIETDTPMNPPEGEAEAVPAGNLTPEADPSAAGLIDENTQVVSAETEAPVQEALSEYRITHFFGTEGDVESYMKARASDGSCASIGRNRTYSCIEVMATPTQAGIWVNSANEALGQIVASEEQKDHFRLDVSEDRRILNITADASWDQEKLHRDVAQALYQMQICQIFSGIPDWSVDFRIVNRHNGAVVYEVQYPQQQIEFTDQVWKGGA